MPNAKPLYKDEFFEFTPGEGLPVISNQLDSIRAYQWEIRFLGLDDVDVKFPKELTLAAKQVGQLGFSVEDIEVHRVNDKVFYPGKASPEELVVTFDNLFKAETGVDLWRWFKKIYDPTTGEFTSGQNSRVGGPDGNFKVPKVEVIQLDNKMAPHSVIELYGVYPKSWKGAELNYSTQEFHTVEVNFRYDFMNVDQYKI